MKKLLLAVLFIATFSLLGLADDNNNSSELDETSGGSKAVLSIAVMEEVTYARVDSVQFELFYNDSIRVPLRALGRNDAYYKFEFVGKPGNYTVWADKEGYVSVDRHFKKLGSRVGNYEPNEIYFVKERRRKLDEVTVVGTHIKMVMRGDTVVYDAAAFELAEGSMLDALVAQLPGCVLKDGQITVNGKFVSSLLVNGKDFFSGNPKIALENLPAYTINNIKVYDKEADDAYLRGGKRPSDGENIVMDVNLKKEYSVGWFGNVDLGYGLNDRYQGKGMLMGYTDDVRLAVYGNLNNVQDTQVASAYGNWGSGWGQDGELDVKMGGLDYLWTFGQNELHGKVMLTHEKTTVDTQTSNVSFYDSGDTYSRSRSIDHDKKFHLITDHSLRVRTKRVFLYITPSLDYLTNNSTSAQRSATFTENPIEDYRSQSLDSLFGVSATDRFAPKVLTRNSTDTDGKNSWVIARLNANSSIALPSRGYDNINLRANVQYNHSKDEPLNIFNVIAGEQSTNSGDRTQTVQQRNNKSTTWSAMGRAEYMWMYSPYATKNSKSVNITPIVQYNYDGKDRDVVLNQLKTEQYESNSPSAYDPGRLALDVDNSYNSKLASHTFNPAIRFHFDFRPDPITHGEELFMATLELSDKIVSENLNYHKAALDTVISRTKNLFVPSLSLYYRNATSAFRMQSSLRYSYTESAPNITYQLHTMDTSSPTDIYTNNDNLHNTQNHSLSGDIYYYWYESRRQISFAASYTATQNSIAQAKFYDRNSGVSTWRPENVDGNWVASAGTSYVLPFARSGFIEFSGSSNFNYRNSVDFATQTLDLTRSEVHNLNLSQEVAFQFNVKRHAFTLRGKVNWLKSNSQLALFDPISAFDYTATANITLNFPYNWQLTTDMNMYARRGYNDNTLNSTDWVWNASVSKSLLKGKFTVKLNAVDMLGQISHVRKTINAQGRTETWVNSMPRYAMLHLIYRFQIMPKKH